MQVVYSGFDGLDVSFQGALPPVAIDALERAKEQAQEDDNSTLATIGRGRVDMHVASTGAKGGYRYRCDTGPDGEVWFFKRGKNPTDWNIRVSVGSACLATRGYYGTKQRLYETLEALGAIVLCESIGRVDYAIDYLDPDFEIRPSDFVAHSSSNRKAHEEEESSLQTAYKGRYCTSVTVGTMPNRQIIVYDKRREVIARRKSYWWDIWGLDQYDTENKVWRVEIRAGKRHLKEKWNVSTWDELETMLGDLFLKALKDIRYLAGDNADSNRTRADIDPIWETTQEQVSGDLFEWISGVEPSDIREVEREKQRLIYEQMIVGCVAGMASLMEIEKANISTVVPRIEGLLRLHIRTNLDGLEKKMDRARHRYHFVNKREGVNGEKSSTEERVTRR